MTVDRRTVMTGAVLGGAAMASGAASAAAAAGATPAVAAVTGKIVHHVFFWLKNPGNAADRDSLIAGLRGLAAIKEIKDLQIGVPASTEKRDVVDSSFDVSELMYFDTVADQKIYQDHPVHQAFVKNCAHLWAKVIVYDMVTV